MDGDPRRLTFSQAQGYEELPQRLQLEELPEEARTRIWNVLVPRLGRDITGRFANSEWSTILYHTHSEVYNQPLDEWGPADAIEELRNAILGWSFEYVFDLVQFILRHPRCPREVIHEMKEAFEKGMLAYVIDNNGPPTIFPACTTEEGQSLTESLHILQQGGLSAAADLLRVASTDINREEWARSIKNSIDAAESVARTLVPRAQTFGAALNELKRTPALWHPQIVRAMENIWTYTNRAGIRHGSPEQTDENVGQEEALFMLGSCASIASFLWRKHPAGERSQEQV